MVLDFGAVSNMAEPEDNRKYPILKPDNYVCYVDEFSNSKSKSGMEMVSLTLKISEGDSANRLIFENYVVDAKKASPKVIEISNKKLWNLATAIGYENELPSDEAAYVGKRVVAVIKQRQAKSQGVPVVNDAGNPVKEDYLSYYKKLPVTATKSAPPWQNK